MNMFNRKLLVSTPSFNSEIKKPHHIAYTEWGDPNNPHVVVCVHGLTRNCRDFDYLAQVLSKTCRVICVDVVGRGQSDWLENAKDYDYYPLYISDAAELIAHIKDQYDESIRLDWIGISLGGLIGMMLAIQPDISVKLNKLVMSDIGPLIPMSALSRMSEYVGKDLRFSSLIALKDYIKKISVPFGPLSEEQWHHMTVHSARQFEDGQYGFCYDPKISISFKEHALKDIDLWEYWDQLTIPTLVLRGAKSDVLNTKTAEEMRRRGAGATIVDFPWIGHAPVLMDDEQIAVVQRFLMPTHLSCEGSERMII